MAKVGGENITYNHLLSNLINENGQVSLDNLIGKSLIEQEVKSLKINDISTETEIKQLQYVKMFNPKHITIADKETKRFVEEYIKIKLLAEKYTINETSIKNFLNKEKASNGGTVLDVMAIQGTHEQVMEIESAIKKGVDIAPIIEKQTLDVEYTQIFPVNNEFEENFSNLKVGEYKHLMIHEKKHEIVVVKAITDAESEILNIEKNRERILDVYMSKNFYIERENVINYLKMKYEVSYNENLPF